MDGESSITFFQKNATSCPVCDKEFFREEMRTGRGRLIAGKLTHELRRTYEPSQKYGAIHPLIYPVVVCPHCYYAAFAPDFATIKPEAAEVLNEKYDERREQVERILPPLDFTSPRQLKEGLASYYLSTLCYEHAHKDVSPTFKKGLCCLRAAWVANDMHKKHPNDNYDYLARVFYRKARFFYAHAIELEQTGKEKLSSGGHLGPDLDKNYGYDGVLYVTGMLEYRYGPSTDPEKRKVALNRAKRTIARIFGMGRASKDKPAAILDNARDVYEQIAKELGSTDTDPENPDA